MTSMLKSPTKFTNMLYNNYKTSVLIPKNFQIAIINQKSDCLVLTNGLLGTVFLQLKNVNVSFSLDHNKLGQSSLDLVLQTNFKALLRTYENILKNSFIGLSSGFKRYIQLQGLGYRSQVKQHENRVILKIGFSHIIRYQIPDGVKIKKLKKNVLKVYAVSWEKLWRVCYTLRNFKKPDPYKAKGVIFRKEQFKLKVGKRTKR